MRSENPWAMVIGSDSPSFALYADGRVIYQTAQGYRTAILTRAELQSLWQGVHPSALAGLAGSFAATEITDQPQTYLLVYGARPFAISIYGSLDSAEERGKLPGPLVLAADRLRAFRAPRSTAWLPEKVEVIIWPYEYALERVQWPSDWPTWKDSSAVRRGDSYSIYLSPSEIPRLDALIARLPEKGAVEIAGKKWSVVYRFPFPHEELWMPPKRS